MANWMLIEDLDSKMGTLVNLDLVPHVSREPDGSVMINIRPDHTLTIKGKTAAKAWEYITHATVGKNPQPMGS